MVSLTAALGVQPSMCTLSSSSRCKQSGKQTTLNSTLLKAPLSTAVKRSAKLQPYIVRATSYSTAEAADEMSVEDLKYLLQDTLWGTDRGLSATSDTRAELNEIITQLEAKNPTPLPNEAVEKLNGSWKLAYTSNSELMALLALGRLPFVTVGDIMQIVDTGAMTVENRIQLSAPFSRTSLAASASFEVRSPKLLQIKFEEGEVATPELLSDFELPASVEVLGNTIDLTPLQTALQPMEGPVRSLISQVGGVLSGAPDFKFPINSPASSSTWLLNTYLDDDLRISRGDGGSIFVLTKLPPLELPSPPVYESTNESVVPPAMETSTPSAVVVEPSQVIQGDGAANSDQANVPGFFDN